MEIVGLAEKTKIKLFVDHRNSMMMECNAVEWNGMDRWNAMQWSGMEWMHFGHFDTFGHFGSKFCSFLSKT